MTTRTATIPNGAKAVRPSQVHVYTDRYHFAHGRQPKGYGAWAFHPNFNVDCQDPEIIWVYQATYAEAKKAAKNIAALRGWTELEALS